MQRPKLFYSRQQNICQPTPIAIGAPRTIRNYSSEMRYIFSYYNEKDPALIDQDDIIHYINFIKKQFGSGYDKCRMVAQACSFFYKHILKSPYVVPSAFYPR